MATTVQLASLSSDQTKMVEMAAQASRGNGDPAPESVSWVYASRGAIADAMQFGIPEHTRSTENILIQIVGAFKPNHRHPRGAVLPVSAAAVALVIDPKTWSITDSSIGDRTIDLESLGLVYRIPGPLPQ